MGADPGPGRQALYLAKHGGRNAAVGLAPGAPLPADFERRLEQDFEALLESGVVKVLREG